MIRLGIAGVGRIAKDYIGLIAEGKTPDIVLSALSSRNENGMRETLSGYPALQSVKTFTKYEGMLNSGAVDAVLICTPHGLHPSMTSVAVKAGIHVLVEKPVGIFCDDVENSLNALCDRPDLICGVMYNRRASPVYKHIKGLIEQGDLGELVRCTWLITNLYRTNAYYHSSSWRGSWSGEGGGLLMTQASHQLDLMQWLVGMPCSVWARCSSINRPIVTENEAELMLTYPNGAHGHFIASAHECPGTNMLEICGTKGRIRLFDDSDLELELLCEDERNFACTCQSPFDKVAAIRKHYRFQAGDNKKEQAATIQNFARAIMGEETIQCSLKEGLRSLEIIHGAYYSQWKGSEVSLPVPEKEFRKLLENQSSK